jgi:hypothetical protein
VLIKQIYETTVHDIDTGLEGRFLVVPRSAYSRMPETDGAFRELAETLGLRIEHQVEPTALAVEFAQCLLADDPRFREAIERRRAGEAVSPEPFVEHIKFAEVLAFGPVVPFQRNPLNLEAVASIITGASGVGLGAFAGFVIAGGSPLILVTVPAGMIIFGAAAGIAKALEEGLRERLREKIKGH